VRRVVITGMGAITPVGLTLEESWKNICAGKSGGERITQFDPTAFSCQIGAEVKGFTPEMVVEKKEIRRYDRFSLFGLKSAKEAWIDAGLNVDCPYLQKKMGVILGVGIGGLYTLEMNHEALVKEGPRKISPFLIPAMISNLAPGNIGIELGLKGVNYTITSACTSGNHAIGEAFRMIQAGLQDLMITGGTEAAITPLGVGGFARMRALTTRNDDPQHASRPFDRDRDGFLIGEGAGVLVLEELESAKKRGARIYGEVVGYGFSCDAHHITAPVEDGAGAIACMTDAIEMAEMNVTDIGYVNAHGTSTPLNDKAETAAIKKVFGDYAHQGLMVSSTKSMTGHLLGAAGGVEAVFCTMAIYDGILPPTINLENPDEGCDLDYIPNEARAVKVNATISNSFGFGGTNASIVMKRF